MADSTARTSGRARYSAAADPAISTKAAALPVRDYAYDVRLRTAGGEVHTIIPKSTLALREEIGHV